MDVCESKSRQSALYVAVQQQLVEAVRLLIHAGKSQTRRYDTITGVMGL